MEHREWLCAIDLKANSEGLLRYAAGFAAAAGARLSLIHVISEGDGKPPSEVGPGDGVRSWKEREALRQIEDLQSRVGCQAPVRVAAGPIKEALIEEVRRLDADVLVVGRDSQPGAGGRMRDLIYALVRDSLCPVASI
jgi:nucleotide-binding universal stress UspA family protein